VLLPVLQLTPDVLQSELSAKQLQKLQQITSDEVKLQKLFEYSLRAEQAAVTKQFDNTDQQFVVQAVNDVAKKFKAELSQFIMESVRRY